MTAKAEISLQFSSKRVLESFVAALLPEIRYPVAGRTKVFLEKEKTSMTLKVDAENTTDLRSSLNSYLRWIGSITDVIEMAEHSS